MKTIRDRAQQAERLHATAESQDIVDIRLCIAGDNDAFARLVRRYEQVVAAQMWRFTRDRQVLDELVQDVFVEAHRSLRTFEGRAPFGHWLSRISTRTGYRHWRNQDTARRREIVLERNAAQFFAMTIDPEPADAAAVLHDLLALLPTDDRLVLQLFYFEGLDTQEIASHMGWNSTLVKVRAFRARRKLRRWLVAAGVGRLSDGDT